MFPVPRQPIPLSAAGQLPVPAFLPACAAPPTLTLQTPQLLPSLPPNFFSHCQFFLFLFALPSISFTTLATVNSSLWRGESSQEKEADNTCNSTPPASVVSPPFFFPRRRRHHHTSDYLRNFTPPSDWNPSQSVSTNTWQNSLPRSTKDILFVCPSHHLVPFAVRRRFVFVWTKPRQPPPTDDRNYRPIFYLEVGFPGRSIATF